MNNSEVNQLNFADGRYTVSVNGNNAVSDSELSTFENSEEINSVELTNQDCDYTLLYFDMLQDENCEAENDCEYKLDEATNMLNSFVARLNFDGFDENTISNVLSNINFSDNTINKRLESIIAMSREDLKRFIDVASNTDTLKYPQLYDEYNFLINGQRLDSSLDNLNFDINGKTINIKIDNNVVSGEYMAAHPDENYTVFDTTITDTIQALLQNSKDNNLEIPDTFYITNFFGYDERLNDKAYAYSTGESGIMLNASAIQNNDYLINTIYHETAHYNDSLSDWVSERCNVKIGEYLDDGNGGKYLQKYCVILSDEHKIYPEDIAKCITEYASTNNLEFVAEVTTAILKGDVIKNQNGSYSFGKQKEELNAQYLEKLNDIMTFYNFVTQGKIL